MNGRSPRTAAVLVLVLAALLLLSVVTTLIARRMVLSRRALAADVALVQAESVWMAAADTVRSSGLASDLQFELPGQGPRSRTATAVIRDAGDGWEIEVTLKQNGRVIARRRGTVPAASAPAAETATARQEGEGETQ